MNRLILCEGKTDAILLGYYLMKTDGWALERKPPSGLDIKAQEQNENVVWYKKGNEKLMICAVGGKDNFGQFFSRYIQRPIFNASNGDPFPELRSLQIGMIVILKKLRETLPNSFLRFLMGPKIGSGLSIVIWIPSVWRKKLKRSC